MSRHRQPHLNQRADVVAFLAGPASKLADELAAFVGPLNVASEAFDEVFDDVVATRADDRISDCIERLMAGECSLDLCRQLDSDVLEARYERARLAYLVGVAVGQQMRARGAR